MTTDHADPYYVLGRLAGAASVVQGHRQEHNELAADRIVHWGTVTRLALNQMAHELLANTPETRSESQHVGEARRLHAECWPIISLLPKGQRMSNENRALVVKGYHHGRGALLGGLAGRWRPPSLSLAQEIGGDPAEDPAMDATGEVIA